MDNIYHDIFYNTRELSLNDKFDIINFAKDNCIKWNVDILDCSISCSRQNINMTFEEIINKLNNGVHYTIVHRNGYFDNQGEICFSTLSSPSYYLWIYVTVETLNKIIKEYKLKQV